ncbi:hypothetical protein [Pseudomonas chlororaphis]|uniref:hypothetical protein n=1 Tax=Pseudomonas chlororaphis TaxID=587753 RepID=UPI0011857432|nr:hypothetical protein [Pseudomonas chlororaphis]
MSSQIQNIFDQIQKTEIDSIYIYSSAVLEPQSDIAEEIYGVYGSTISDDIYHNYHTEIHSGGLSGLHNFELREIPSFKEFIIGMLRNNNRDRHEHVLLNHREQFVNLGLNGYEPNYLRFSDNLHMICKTAKNIANHLEIDSYFSADQELARLRERFSDFYPKYKEMIELKPSFFGLSIDLVALEENISTALRRYKK